MKPYDSVILTDDINETAQFGFQGGHQNVWWVGEKSAMLTVTCGMFIVLPELVESTSPLLATLVFPSPTWRGEGEPQVRKG